MPTLRITNRVHGGRMTCGAIRLYKRPPGPVRHHVKGAPFQPGTWVRVVDLVELDVYKDDDEAKELTDCLGCKGLVHYLNYDTGLGIAHPYPSDPQISVRLLAAGVQTSFWPEELEAV